MKLTSRAFQNEEAIPKRYSGEGSDISPPLEWSEIPKDTHEFALVCEDTDSTKIPGRAFVHWVIYNISPTVSALPEGLGTQERMEAPVQVDQGMNSFGKVGYGGPMPSERNKPHHYHFKLYALDGELGIIPGASEHQVLQAIRGHTIECAELVGIYERRAA